MTTPIKKLMLAAFAAFTLCLGAKAQTIDLSLLTADYTAQDGDVLTGSTAYGVIIPDGATVTLAGVNVVPSSGPAISCAGEATILLADGTANFARGNPGVRLPDDTSKTLTITIPEGGDGSGALTATGNWGGAGIGNTYDVSPKGNLHIAGGNITAAGGSGARGIGSGNGDGSVIKASVGTIAISGGTITATGAYNCAAIGGYCGAITIGPGVQKIVASTTGWSVSNDGIIDSYKGSVTIASSLRKTYSNDGLTLTIEPDYKYNITWLNDDGTEIDTTIVPSNAVPVHAEPTKEATAPYRWVFTGWSPELEAAVSNTTYTATFKKIADLSLCTSDWTAADGDEIVGETTHNLTIPSGAHVTIKGISVTGAGGGSAPAPAFAEGGASEIVKFAQAEGGKWTITAFAEMSNESRGTDVTDGQIKVYSADTLEALKSVTTPAAGATVKETKSAVKATVEVPAPGGKTSQFFKVKFGE